MAFFNRNNSKLITVHHNSIKLWSFDQVTKKIKFFDCPMGHVKRYITCVSIDSYDDFAYCGTRSGDILEVSLAKGIYSRSGPVDKKFVGAVNQIISTSNFKSLYVGTSEGKFARVDKKTLLVNGEADYPSCSITCLAASKSKVYFISNRGTVRSISDNLGI